MHIFFKSQTFRLPGFIIASEQEQEGYTFVPISEIILKGEYTIDHTGRQCPK